LAFLENDTMILRAPEKDDLELLYKWENNSEMWFCGTTLAPFSKHVLEQYLDTAHLDLFEAKQLRLMIDLKTEDKKTIGAVDLFELDIYNSRAGIGILIADESDRKQGFASSALKLVIDYSFNLIGLQQLFCSISSVNQNSLNLFKKHGFEIIGLKKKWTRRGNNYEDEYFMQLINLR
jgi:diamine N-acetyltransferase